MFSIVKGLFFNNFSNVLTTSKLEINKSVWFLGLVYISRFCLISLIVAADCL
ncbi:Uncharacterised protein [Chlamydia trachomatis]|nr:Uncharacterised protein [Chlamydia trachomatis]CRH55261.1 Uncharacterised protein [Chlamydia trachomatis]